eukprot:4821041-Amphidinium_carterae.1
MPLAGPATSVLAKLFGRHKHSYELGGKAACDPSVTMPLCRAQQAKAWDGQSVVLPSETSNLQLLRLPFAAGAQGQLCGGSYEA